MTAKPDAVEYVMSDDEVRRWWVQWGGRFHGPNVETGTMPEEKLLPMLRKLMAKP